ncbi:cold-shock protein [Winslowiella iniecta]|uniref:cold shock small protein YmcF n=1 Tax=Winslowiella iniecta TaxID=1560201 RepID=UPI00092D5397|nr:cold-shock protein [Winslowiella iniecta]
MKVFILNLKFKCPCCHGHQYRSSLYDVSPKNPHGAVCIFCKSGMTVSYLAVSTAIADFRNSL